MRRYAVNLAEIEAAGERIAPHVRTTPVMTCRTLDRMADRRLFFKCEQFQRSGSFKIRGASNSVLSLPEDRAARGVVTHSSGNFAQALALAARIRGVQATIVMPRDAAKIKRNSTKGYGGDVVPCEPTLRSREMVALKVIEETGGTFIHPYDQAETIAGQGTIALEFLRQVPELDGIVVPVGGGGLVSGITLAAREIKPSLAVFGAEPQGADDAARSKESKRLIPQTGPRTVADGLRTSLGNLTWPVVRDLVRDVFTVPDDEILRSMRLLWERAKLLAEPSAAVALAAALSDRFHELSGMEHVGVVLSGGNVDLDSLPW